MTAPRKPRVPRVPEATVLQAAEMAARAHPAVGMVWRSGAAGMAPTRRGADGAILGLRPLRTERGVGDLTAIVIVAARTDPPEMRLRVIGQHVEIECKASDGRLSDDQRARAARLAAIGAAYVVVRSGDETRTALDAVASGATLWPPAGDAVWRAPQRRPRRQR